MKLLIDFGREVCGDLDAATRREWLITNGIGGYASGTISGILTRRYHGLLVAALKPPVDRVLQLVKLDEIVDYDGAKFPLFTNQWSSDVIEPEGYRYIERFRLEGTTPVWTYSCADALIEKRVWMQPGENTTYIQYHVTRASQTIHLSIKAIVNYRDHHADTHADETQPMKITSIKNGLKVTASSEATPYFLLSDSADVSVDHTWLRGYHLEKEAYRGLTATEDHLHAGTFQATLAQGDYLTLIASLDPNPNLDGNSAYNERRDYEHELIEISHLDNSPLWIQQLVLSADQFIVKRSSSVNPSGNTIIAGYHWFTDWGRDTMISIPGLTLTTHRPDVARNILRTYAAFVDQGILPNRFPDAGIANDLNPSQPEYNTVDATLWFFEAIRAYHDFKLQQSGGDKGDGELIRELFPVLQQVIKWHIKGTHYGIHIDSNDGLLYAGEQGIQLTWMDAKVGDWVVTPRIGKPIEVNALWFNAIKIMVKFAQYLGESPDEYIKLARVTQEGFSRFWNKERGYCYDVIDGPQGDESSLRPNQLIAISLHFSPLESWQQKRVVDACARELLASHGMRSLSPQDIHYNGKYTGDIYQRDGAYHQGTVWGWLIGPFVEAHLRVYHDVDTAASFLKPFVSHLNDYGLGSISEIFDGDPPFPPRGCIAQAWSVAEVLRIWNKISIITKHSTEKSLYT